METKITSPHGIPRRGWLQPVYGCAAGPGAARGVCAAAARGPAEGSMSGAKVASGAGRLRLVGA